MTTDTTLRFLQPLDTQSRGVAVLDALAEMIEQAGLQVGDRLPPEVSLANALGVGRSTIREALNRWEGLGAIRRRRGDGTYLAAPVQRSTDLVPTMVRLEGQALLRFLDVRRVLEREVVARAARLANTEQRKRISERCDALLAIVDQRQPYRKADEAFHSAVYDSCGNPVFGHILRNLEKAIHRPKDSPLADPTFAVDSFPAHRDLSNAIIAGNPEAAVAAVDRILDVVVDAIRSVIGDAGQKVPTRKRRDLAAG